MAVMEPILLVIRQSQGGDVVAGIRVGLPNQITYIADVSFADGSVRASVNVGRPRGEVPVGRIKALTVGTEHYGIRVGTTNAVIRWWANEQPETTTECSR